jgi:hypothetical protein
VSLVVDVSRWLSAYQRNNRCNYNEKVSYHTVCWKCNIGRQNQYKCWLLNYTAKLLHTFTVTQKKSKRTPSIFNDESTGSFICLRRYTYMSRHFYAYRLYFINMWHVYVSPKTYKWSGTFITKDGRYMFIIFIRLHNNKIKYFVVFFFISTVVPTFTWSWFWRCWSPLLH